MLSAEKILTPPKSSPVQPVSGTALNDSSPFVTLFEADQNRLYSYIYAYVLNYAAADDIFQEVSITLWRNFHKFELGTSFAKWANTIAFNQVRTYRRKNKKYALGLSEDFLDQFKEVVAIAESEPEPQSKKWWHLTQCSTLLSDPMKKVYQDFYHQEYSAQEIADNTGRSIFAIRKSIHKLRKKLFDCVEQKTQGES